jgi:hypothetical protein
MADRVLFIGWGAPVAGAEKNGLEVFNRVLHLYSQMRRDGRIVGYEVTLLDRKGDLGGFMQLHGSADQISAVRRDVEFQRAIIEASAIAENPCMFEADSKELIAERMGVYQTAISQTMISPAAISKLPIAA